MEDAVLKGGEIQILGKLQRVTVDRGRAPNCQFPCKRKLIYFGVFFSYTFVEKGELIQSDIFQESNIFEVKLCLPVFFARVFD